MTRRHRRECYCPAANAFIKDLSGLLAPLFLSQSSRRPEQILAKRHSGPIILSGPSPSCEFGRLLFAVLFQWDNF